MNKKQEQQFVESYQVYQELNAQRETLQKKIEVVKDCLKSTEDDFTYCDLEELEIRVVYSEVDKYKIDLDFELIPIIMPLLLKFFKTKLRKVERQILNLKSF